MAATTSCTMSNQDNNNNNHNRHNHNHHSDTSHQLKKPIIPIDRVINPFTLISTAMYNIYSNQPYTQQINDEWKEQLKLCDYNDKYDWTNGEDFYPLWIKYKESCKKYHIPKERQISIHFGNNEIKFHVPKASAQGNNHIQHKKNDNNTNPTKKKKPNKLTLIFNKQNKEKPTKKLVWHNTKPTGIKLDLKN